MFIRTTDRRQAFANDLTRPQLIAVTNRSGQVKGDRDPAEWMPPEASFACTYIRAWITVKHFYDLSVDKAEFEALKKVLGSC